MAMKKNKILKRILAPSKAAEAAAVADTMLPDDKKKRKLDIWNKIAIAILSLFLVVCISIFFVLVNIINDPEGMRFSKDGLSTLSNSRIFDTNGSLIYEFGEEIREDVKYDQIPQTVVDSFLAIEDSRFFDHNGFDLPRFLSAAMVNLRTGEFSQGGSTLTMQMIDNAFTSNQMEKLKAQKGSVSKPEQLKLKIQEIYLSLVAEQTISKEAVFEYYVNRIWFGSGGNTRGIQKAAEYYFNKDVSQLNLSEAAFLAGTVNAPGEYNPMGNLYDFENDHLKAGEKRRNVTLDLMLKHGYISKEEYKLAKNTKLAFELQRIVPSAVLTDPNEAYINQVIDEVRELTGQDPSIIPMDIYTALNPDVQQQADEICKGNIINFPDDMFDVGFAVLDNLSGEIIAVGPGRTYHEQAVKIDNSTDRKQPGSSMKPVVAYSSTFDILGWSTEHQVPDQKKDYWQTGSYLHNSDGVFNGSCSLAYALGMSKNTCAAQAMVDLVNVTGYDYWINFLRECGYDEDVCERFNEQYSIGGSDMWASPIQQASAYSMFANRGVRIDAHRVRSIIRRSDGEETSRNPASHQLITSGAAFMTSFLLYKVVNGGFQNFNNMLMDNYPCYGKSGTSDWGDAGLQYGIPEGAIRDEWSVGYTSQFTIACWSGYTSVGFTQGYYIPTSVVKNYTQAFQISDYLLDYCQQYGVYVDIPVPEDVTQYGNGYIRTEYILSGDSSSDYDDDDEDKDEDEDEYEDEDFDNSNDSDQEEEYYDPNKDPYDYNYDNENTESSSENTSTNTNTNSETTTTPEGTPRFDNFYGLFNIFSWL